MLCQSSNKVPISYFYYKGLGEGHKVLDLDKMWKSLFCERCMLNINFYYLQFKRNDRIGNHKKTTKLIIRFNVLKFHTSVDLIKQCSQYTHVIQYALTYQIHTRTKQIQRKSYLGVDIGLIAFQAFFCGSNSSPLFRCFTPSWPPTAYRTPENVKLARPRLFVACHSSSTNKVYKSYYDH